MGNLRINPIKSVDVYSLRKVMTTSQLTDHQKVNFVRKNSAEVRSVLKNKLSTTEYNLLVSGRTLKDCKSVIKGALTKREDKILLAKALNVGVKDVDGCITKVIEAMKGHGDLSGLSKNAVKTMHAYVYKHGTKHELMMFLDTELSLSKNLSRTLHKTLKYKTDGVADYFRRPMHKLDNSFLVSLYKVIDKNITKAELDGKLSEHEATKLAKWSLQRVCEIQHQQKLVFLSKFSKPSQSVPKQNSLNHFSF